MISQQFTGILLILGFVFILVASIIGPPRLYQEQDSQTQLEIITNYPTRWTASNLFFALGGLVTATGLILLSLQLKGNVSAWLLVFCTATFLMGMSLWTIFLYQRTVDPARLFTSYAFSPLTVALVGLIVIGLLLYGIILLQAGYPGWLGVGIIAGMVLIGGIALFLPTQFFNSFPPQVFFMFTLVAGIVMVR